MTYVFGVVALDGASPSGQYEREALLSENTTRLGTISGPIEFAEAGSSHSVRLIPPMAQQVAMSGNFELNPSRNLVDLLKTSEDAQPQEGRASFLPGRGGEFRGALMLNQSAVRLVATDYLISTAASDVDSRWAREGPMSPLGGAQTRTTRVFVLDGECGLQGHDPTDWYVAVSALEARLDGDLVLSNARGTGNINGTQLPVETHLFQSIGHMSASANYEHAGSRWTLNGDPQLVASNGIVLLGSRQAVVASVAAVGLLAAMLGAIAKWGRLGLSLLPGLNVAEPLGNPQRTMLLATVAHEPGIDQSALSERLGIGRGTIRHHLRILLRADLLSERRLLGRHTYTLNDSSYEFAVSKSNVSAGKALAILRHPIRKAIAEALAKGPLASDALRYHLKQIGIDVGRDLAWYHLHQMEQAGIIAGQRLGTGVTWRIDVDVDSIAPIQRQRFLTLGRLERLLEVVSEEPVDVSAIQRRLQVQGERTSTAELVAKLDLLAATGFLAKRGNAYYKPVSTR